jgi:hypothetical protein
MRANALIAAAVIDSSQFQAVTMKTDGANGSSQPSNGAIEVKRRQYILRSRSLASLLRLRNP